ncbi:MAG: hypothetical protein QGH82_05960 [Candidatus Woesearchaeota archaeon]|jgi:hypothetical protein|nr:hypothetical protein [Candidatus Woesearchaeota archaeon]
MENEVIVEEEKADSIEEAIWPKVKDKSMTKWQEDMSKLWW